MASLSVEITGGTGRPDLSQAEHIWSREQQDGILESQPQDLGHDKRGPVYKRVTRLHVR